MNKHPSIQINGCLTPHVDVLDGFRAIAILLVAWLHIWQLSWVPNSRVVAGVTLDWSFIAETGYLGVDLFFFLSACCLFYPHARFLFEGTPLPTLRQFAYRRAIKIVPSYFLAIATIMAWFRPPFATVNDAAAVIGSHLLFAHNLFRDYENVLNGVFWSLGVEVQFYLVFPLLALAFRRRPLAMYGLMCAAAIAFRVYVRTCHGDDMPFWATQMPYFLDLFAHGMLCAYVLVFVRTRHAAFLKHGWLFTLLAFAFAAVTLALMRDLYVTRFDTTRWPGDWAVAHQTHLAAAVLGLVVSSAFASRPWRWLLANRFMGFMSTISYNLYLWHQLLARELFNRRIPTPATPDPHLDPAWGLPYMAIAFGVSIAVAALITNAFERPLLRHGPRGLWAACRRLGRLRESRTD